MTYCTSQQIFSFMQLGQSSDQDFQDKTDFDANTHPTKEEVDEWIEESVDEIDQYTMHAWRETVVDFETHHLEFPQYQRRDGSEIFLFNREIKSLSSASGDKLEVWNGTEYEDYLVTRNEGRNKDYWFDEKMGVIFIKTFPAYLPRNFGVRIKYRFGETAIPNDIKRACIFLTARNLIQSEDRSVLLPEGSSNIPIESKSDKWERKAFKLLGRRRELKVIQT